MAKSKIIFLSLTFKNFLGAERTNNVTHEYKRLGTPDVNLDCVTHEHCYEVNLRKYF